MSSRMVVNQCPRCGRAGDCGCKLVVGGRRKRNADGGEVDWLGLAKLLGVEADHRRDPVAFTLEMQARVQQALTQLGSAGPPTATPTPDATEDEDEVPPGLATGNRRQASDAEISRWIRGQLKDRERQAVANRRRAAEDAEDIDALIPPGWRGTAAPGAAVHNRAAYDETADEIAAMVPVGYR